MPITAKQRGLLGNDLHHPPQPHDASSEANGSNPNASGIKLPEATSRWLSFAAQLLSKGTQRRPSKGGKQSTSPDDAPLLWSLPTGDFLSVRGSWHDLFPSGKGKKPRRLEAVQQRAHDWLAHPTTSDTHAWEALVWLEMLSSAPEGLTPPLAAAILERLATLVEDARTEDPSHDLLCFLFLAIEASWKIGLLCGRDPEGVAWQHRARQSLQRLCETLGPDPSGIAGRYLPYLPLLLASWVRCELAGEAQRISFAGRDVLKTLYTPLLEQALRTLRADGSAVFTEGTTTPLPEWLSAAVKLADPVIRPLAKTVMKGGSLKVEGNLVSPSFSAGRGKWAALRSSFSRDAWHAVVAFDGPRLQLELAGEQLLLSGAWDYELQIDGTPIEPAEQWDEVLWHEDDDVVYLELHAWLDDWALQRQILLPKQAEFVYLADALVGPQPAAIRYRSSYPLAPGVAFSPAAETHEGWLEQGKLRHLTLPLTSPEWRSERSEYDLSAQGNEWHYTATRQGSAIYLPLFLSTKGMSKKKESPFTWRRLTVAEQLRIQSPDIAVAARVQIESEQFVVYRSLGPRGNRTFLGKNVATEFYMGRFQEGKYETIMEVK
jgi:hypothetical protein